MHTSHLSSAVLAAVLIASLPGIGLSQDQKKRSQDTIKLKAELVQIDLLVTDKEGKAVSGLKREDFELLDNNKPQLITHFAYEVSNPVRLKDTTAPQPPIPRTITARELKRVVAFVVDTLHLQYENVYRTQKMLGDFVDNQMQPGDLVLILPTGGGSGLLQQFTSDRTLLHRAIARLRSTPVETEGVTTTRSLARDPFAPGRRELPVDSQNRGSGRLSMPEAPRLNPVEEITVRATLDTLDNLIKSMRQLPGRKLAVYVSEGFRITDEVGRQELSDTIALAARSNVVFYSIDPRGLVAPFPYDASAGLEMIEERGPMAQQIARMFLQNRIDELDSREPLTVLANETGGTFFRNNNDINRGLASLLDDNSAYYLLGFQPEPAKWDGKLHKIKVTVRNRPDLAVVARKSYLARSDAPKPAGDDPGVEEVLEAIESPLVRRDIDLRLTALYIDNPQREPIVNMLLHIDASKLHFIESEGSYHTSLEQVGFVLDANERTVDKFSNTLELNLKPATYQAALKQGFVATRAMNLKPGTYQLRLFVREVGAGLIGTANDFIDIPDMKSDRLSASSLFLAGQTIQAGKATNSAGATPSQRRFTQNGEFSYSLVIYNAKTDEKAKQTQLEMRTRILSGSKVVFAGQSRPVAAGEGSAPPFRTVTGGVIKPLALPPGDYTLEVVVWDKLRKKDSIIRRETDFSVE
ncbi:MAG TPA: VWA domain-containing protein [Blastocatellia bacterium]|nr:VWA domain-containing protein [Blastocatellia bacterium]